MLRLHCSFSLSPPLFIISINKKVSSSICWCYKTNSFSHFWLSTQIPFLLAVLWFWALQLKAVSSKSQTDTQFHFVVIVEICDHWLWPFTVVSLSYGQYCCHCSLDLAILKDDDLWTGLWFWTSGRKVHNRRPARVCYFARMPLWWDLNNAYSR